MATTLQEIVQHVASTYPGTRPSNAIDALKRAPNNEMPYPELKALMPGGTSFLMICFSLERDGWIEMLPKGSNDYDNMTVKLIKK